jgi:hypothetical protein
MGSEAEDRRAVDDGRRLEYLRTEISIALPGRGWLSAVEAMAQLASPVHVLTAWNPGELRPELEANRDRNRRLLDRLRTQGVEVHPAIGASPDGDHHEESYAITGLDRTTAIDLGREFEQAAIFQLAKREQIVLGCDGDWELSRPLVQ